MWVKYVGTCFKQKAKNIWIRLAITFFKIFLIAAKEHTHSLTYTQIYSIWSLSPLLAYLERCLPTTREKLKQNRSNAIHNEFITSFFEFGKYIA